MKIKDIIKSSTKEVVTINGDKLIFDAVEKLVTNKIGSLLVVDDDQKITGIITERDILYENYVNYGSESKINDVMTKEIVIGNLEDDIDYVKDMMINKRIRHMPILKNNELLGMVSIGDILKSQLKDTTFECRYYKEYIEGRY